MPAHSRLYPLSRPVGRAVFSISLRDVVTIGRHASPFRGERAIFWVCVGSVCVGADYLGALWLSV